MSGGRQGLLFRTRLAVGVIPQLLEFLEQRRVKRPVGGDKSMPVDDDAKWQRLDVASGYLQITGV